MTAMYIRAHAVALARRCYEGGAIELDGKTAKGIKLSTIPALSRLAEISQAMEAAQTAEVANTGRLRYLCHM